MRLHALTLAAILVGAVLVRGRDENTTVLDSAAPAPVATRVLLTDPDTCAHLRRVELALGAERVPATDTYLAFPAGAEWPWPPLYDTLVATLASWTARAPGGELALDGVSEPELEQLALRVGPLLGLLAVVATWLAARAIAVGDRRDEAALWAAAFVAFSPATIGETTAGTLDHHALLTCLSALALHATSRVLSARGLRETLLAALPAGALVGLACATSLLGVGVFAAAWIACWRNVRKAAPEDRRDAQRAGLLVCVVAAFTAQLPLPPDVESLDSLGFVAGAHASVVAACLLATLPFLAGFFLGGASERRLFRTITLVVACVLIVWSLPRFAETLAEAVGHYLRLHDELGGLFAGHWSVERSPAWFLASLLALMTPAWFVVPWVQRRFAHGRSSVNGVLVYAAIATTGVLALDGIRAAGVFTVALALGAAWCFASAAYAGLARVVLGVALALNATVAWIGYETSSDERREQLALVEGLRSLRASADPRWPVAGAGAARGVLTVPSWSSQIAYHARMPVVCAPHAALTRPEAFEPYARAWLASDVAELVRYARANDVRFIVTGIPDPVDASLLAALAPSAQVGAWRDTMFEKLARARGSATDFPGLHRVWASEEHTNPNAEDDPPLVAIWEVEPGPAHDTTPQMRAR